MGCPKRRQYCHCVLLGKVGRGGHDRGRRFVCRGCVMESGLIGAKHDLSTDAAAVVRAQPGQMLQGTLVILIPHQQHGSLVVRLGIGLAP